jgi:hypothetical protein
MAKFLLRLDRFMLAGHANRPIPKERSRDGLTSQDCDEIQEKNTPEPKR